MPLGNLEGITMLPMQYVCKVCLPKKDDTQSQPMFALKAGSASTLSFPKTISDTIYAQMLTFLSCLKCNPLLSCGQCSWRLWNLPIKSQMASVPTVCTRHSADTVFRASRRWNTILVSTSSFWQSGIDQTALFVMVPTSAVTTTTFSGGMCAFAMASIRNLKSSFLMSGSWRNSCHLFGILVFFSTFHLNPFSCLSFVDCFRMSAI